MPGSKFYHSPASFEIYSYTIWAYPYAISFFIGSDEGRSMKVFDKSVTTRFLSLKVFNNFDGFNFPILGEEIMELFLRDFIV